MKTSIKKFIINNQSVITGIFSISAVVFSMLALVSIIQVFTVSIAEPEIYKSILVNTAVLIPSSIALWVLSYATKEAYFPEIKA